MLPKLKDRNNIAFIVCITISAFCLTTFLSVFISNLFPEKSESLTEAFENLKMSGALYYLDVVIVGPIFEELLTRGLIMKISKKSFGMIGCHMFHNLIASLPNPTGPLGFILYAVVMIGCGYLAYYFGRDQFPMFESKKELPEKWLAGKGFVFGQNSCFKPTADPYWFRELPHPALRLGWGFLLRTVHQKVYRITTTAFVKIS